MNRNFQFKNGKAVILPEEKTHVTLAVLHKDSGSYIVRVQISTPQLIRSLTLSLLTSVHLSFLICEVRIIPVLIDKM